MELKLFSSLDKIFPDALPESTAPERFTMLKNERFSFQLAFFAQSDSELEFSLSGALAPLTKAYLVQYVPSSLAAFDGADDYYLRKTPGLYPDLLLPVTDTVSVKGNMYHSVFIEINGNGSVSGEKDLTVCIGGEEATVAVNIFDELLPPQELVYTNWFHCDCLCNYYGVKAKSEEFFRICRNFVSAAVSHGMNCILTPLFTPPLDTEEGGERTTVQLVDITSVSPYAFDFSDLDRWVDMCLDCGIEYFEMSHLFTQWGARNAPKIVIKDENGEEKKLFGWFTDAGCAEYEDFIRAFGKELRAFIERRGLSQKVFFHISDEPSSDGLETYMRRAKLIREVFGGYKVFDALSDYEFYELGAVDIPVASEGAIEKFAGRVPELWTYYCCGQDTDYLPNRFMSMPSLRNRILGALLYKYDCKGFLQWGFNFYNSHLSIEKINPYEVTDAKEAFPSGDAFVVYPAPNGEAYISLRLKVFYEGLQDIRALKLLESKYGRETALGFLGDISFTDYPHDETLFFNVREKIYEKIASK